MKHGGVQLLQSKMFPLARTPALPLLISLCAGLVTTATTGGGLACRQEIPAELIRNLWNRTRLLILKLPVSLSVTSDY